MNQKSAVAKHFISYLLNSESLVFNASDIMVLVPIVVMTNDMKEFIPKQKLLVFGTVSSHMKAIKMKWTRF